MRPRHGGDGGKAGGRARPTLPVLLASLVLAVAPCARAQVVISQVYGGGGNTGSLFNRDFIELYNRGTGVVCIGGWSLQYHPAAASSGDWTVTPLSGCIHPGQYFLVQEGTKSNPEDKPPLPAPDVVGEINLHQESGRVALVMDGEKLGDPCPLGLPNLADFVGYGDTWAGDSGSPGLPCFEGSGSAPKLDNEHAAIRAGVGAIDTDDNSDDFVKHSPTPRNSAFGIATGHIRRHVRDPR